MNPEDLPTYDEALLGIKTKLARQRAVLQRHGMPQHWKPPSSKIGRIIFNALSLMALGHPGMEPTWTAIKLEEEGDESVWAERIQQLVGRLSSMNVVAGLLLTTCATFLTTLPPKPDMINYTLRGPYMCVGGSFALLIGAIIVGSTAYLVAGTVKSHWAKEVLYCDHLHIYCTLLLLSYPFISIGVATMLLAFGVWIFNPSKNTEEDRGLMSGLLSAVWSSPDQGIQGAVVIVFLFPLFMGALFGVSIATALHKFQLMEGQQVISSERISQFSSS
ncbi:hypothetical protein GYMLUDRAFT_644792 [Collybiopsis luxurians FD-317 M1]|nr:hypothetical protein GYMLUDRAFT_644792 [Collybiopsis luxurians FD-317 M1]